MMREDQQENAGEVMSAPGGIEDVYTLSPMQQGMLFHTVYAPTQGIYIDQVVCSLSGVLDSVVLQYTWQRIIAQHPLLRTSFVWEGLDEPVQVVSQTVQLPWEQLDWRNIPIDQRRGRLNEWLAADRTSGFDLEQAPLIRLALIQITSDTWYFVWTFHHMLCDGWSVFLILQEMLTVYSDLTAGHEPSLPARRPYREYISWLRRQDLHAAEAFWRQRLSGFSTPTRLAPERPANLELFAQIDTQEPFPKNTAQAQDEFWRQSNQAIRLQGITLSAEVTAALSACTRQQRLTLNTVLQGAWALLLSRYSGESDVLFGATVAGRPASISRIEKMVGLFLNTLPVRVSVSPKAILLPWLQQLQEQELEARQYEYSPLAQVQSWSEVHAGQPLFESLVVFESYPIDRSIMQANTVSDVQFRWHYILEQTNLPLSVIVEARQELSILFGYDTTRFTADAIQRMLRHLRTILESVVTHLDAPLATIPFVSQNEQQQMLARWNPSTPALTYTSTHLLEHLQQQAEQRPDTVALVWREMQVTYAELERQANQLAHALQGRGIGPEVPVGVCIERTPTLAVALLGILKAGGVYLPLDPTHPAERLAYMLRNAQARLVLIQQRFQDLFAHSEVSTLCIDATDQKKGDEPGASPVLASISPEQAAYIIYTSGSTGLPKGVVVSHRALLHHNDAVSRHYSLRSHDRVLQFAAPIFDVSLEELLPPWFNGATVVMWPEATAPSLAELSQLAEQEHLSVLNLPSSYWYEWISELARTHTPLPSALRLLIAGSERVQAAALLLWQQLAGDRVAWCNAYGLSETTITALATEPGNTRGWERLSAVPIGRPLGQTRVYVLDAQLRPLPIGVPGDLYIEGASLARGYLESPALTGEHFLPDPFAQGEGGARLYRTGDRACTLPDGTLQFLGRSDTQVKLRGFRIELGEVEAVLRRYPGVREAVVVVQSQPIDQQGQSTQDAVEKKDALSLTAYIATSRRTAAMHTRLRRYLEAHLAPPMVPGRMVLIEAFPRTPGGKIDPHALTALEQPASAETELYVSPQTPVEEIVASIWSAVLGRERIGRDAHFFKLGGHSLQAAQMVARVREALQVDLPLRAVYDTPMLVGLSEYIQQLRGKVATKLALPPIGRAEHHGEPRFPLSFAQQRLWVLDQLEPQQPYYNMPSAVYLRGRLVMAALEDSFKALAQRHEPLRTAFALLDGEAVQVVAPTLPLVCPLVDLSGLTQREEQEKLALALLNEEAQLPFDLAHAPLWRVKLLRLSGEEHMLVLTFHHIITDGWSVGILFRELSTLYAAYSTGSLPALSALPIQYTDYALWQRKWLQQMLEGEHLVYWRAQLADAPTVLELPGDFRRPVLASFRGASLSFSLPEDLVKELHALSQREGVTLFMTLLAVFQVLLMRLSGQTDIVVGTPVAGRSQRETEELIGLFLNTLVLRTNLGGNPSFAQLLARVREVCLEAYEHQEVPFEQLVEALQPVRSPAYAPLFQVMFILQNAPAGWLTLPGLALETVEVKRGTAKFDLTLEMAEHNGELLGMVEYNTDLFAQTTIMRMIGNFRRLLEGVVAQIQQPIGALPLLTEQERRQLLVTWNATQAQIPLQSCLHHFIEEQVTRTPAAIAVVYGEAQVTYEELNRRADQVAHYLRRLEVGPNVLVSICMERCVELIVGILGILKAGGAYVPLDPDYPTKRLAFMLEDAQAAVVLTQSRLLTKLSGQVRAICLDGDWPLLERESAGLACDDVGPMHLAYVIYTSGSTGRPKGVLISHQNAVSSTAARLAYYRDPVICYLLLSSFAFDSSVAGLFWTLSQGGRVLLPPDTIQHDLPELIAQQQVSHILSVPSLYDVILKQAEPEKLASLRVVIAAGESCPPELAQWHHRHLPHAAFFNEYGPTEGTVWCTVYQAQPEDEQALIPIGRPISGTQVYVLDQQMEPVPIGVPGELSIGGKGVAYGYLRRPDLTAERFLPHPYSRQERLYRTGDLVRFRPDGNLEFLGRLDQQIKLRGFRIELEEVEALLRQHPAVREAVVSLREDRPGEQRLVAYVVLLAPQRVLPGDELRGYLQERIPDSMLPAIFVTLEALPLSPNGKVNRTSLPPPDWEQQRKHTEGFSTPRTALEKTLAVIWADVLGLERVGIYDNFFALGGDSIQVIQINARAHQAHVQILPRQIFQHQTIAELAQVVSTSSAAIIDQQMVVGPVPLTPIQHWFFERGLAEPHHYNQSLMVEAEELDAVLLEEALAHLLRHHDALRMRFTHNESGWQQYNAAVDEVEGVGCLHVDFTHLTLEEQEKAVAVVAAELHASMSLEQGPLLCAALFERGASPGQWLLLIAHHLVVDGVSWRILLEDLETAYGQLRRREELRLPPKTSSFQDWAQSLVAYASTASLQQEADYWLSRRTLSGSRLPVDYSASTPEANVEAEARTVVVTLSRAETQALLQDVHKAYHTQINDVLLAALAQTMRTWTGTSLLLLDLEGHGREEIVDGVEVSRTVGWFTTIFPVLLDIADAHAPGEIIMSVKEQLRHIPHHGIGHGVLRYLRSDQEISRQLKNLPQAEISFNYLGQVDQMNGKTALFKPAYASSGPNFSMKAQRKHAVDILGNVADGQFHVAWIYSQEIHKPATMSHVAQEYIHVLRHLIAHCLAPESGGHTPSDFPLARLNARALHKVAQLISEGD